MTVRKTHRELLPVGLIAACALGVCLPSAHAQQLSAQSARALEATHSGAIIMEPGTALFADMAPVIRELSAGEPLISSMAAGNSGGAGMVILQRTSANELNPTRIAPQSARLIVRDQQGISVERQLAFELLELTSGNALPSQQAPELELVTLEQAVRRTMDHDLILQQSQQDLMEAKGRRRAATGPFDLTLVGNAIWKVENTPVSDFQSDTLKLAQATRLQVARILENTRRDLARDIRVLEQGGVPEDPVDFSELVAGLADLGDGVSVEIDLEGLDPSIITLDPNAELLNRAQIEALRELAGGEAAFQRLVQLEGERRREILGLYKLIDKILGDFQRGQARDRRRAEGIAFVNNQKETNYQVSLRRLFRNGLTFATGLEFTRTGKNGRNNPTTNRGKIFGDLTIPLLRRAGQTSVWADEKAAILDEQGAEWRVRNTATTSVRRTVRAYWDVVAAQQSINILNHSLALSYDLMRETDRLLQAERATEGDNVMALARYQEILAQRTAAERNLFAARRELSLAMGWNPPNGEEMTVFPVAKRLFAAPISIESLEKVDPLSLAKEAITMRPDVMAQRDNVAASRILRDAARRDQLPRADFGFRIFAATVEEGSEYERLADVYGRDKVFGGGEVRFNMEWPFGNNRALGELAQRETEIIRQEIRLGDLERQITARLLVTYARLYTSLGELKRANLSYKSYGKARDYQIELFGAGTSTIGNLIEAEQRLTDSGQTLVQAIKAHNQALIDFNFESGNLLTRGVGPIDINYANLDSLPYQAPQTSSPTPSSAAPALN